ALERRRLNVRNHTEPQNGIPLQVKYPDGHVVRRRFLLIQPIQQWSPTFITPRTGHRLAILLRPGGGGCPSIYTFGTASTNGVLSHNAKLNRCDFITW
ncbi:hypothetical protein ATANTOWER_030563, partial [Ataeniobius toweri]|nr:hypothetical protein [Ataeniobius toweri]